MLSPGKFLSLAGIIIFLGFQVWIISDQFSQTRSIDVQRNLPKTQLKFKKQYYNITEHTEEVTIIVTPAGFFDYLLLTNSNGNLLSIILTILTVVCLVIYNFFRPMENVFWFAQFMFRFIFVAFIVGIEYTNHSLRDYSSEFTSDIFIIRSFKVPLCILIMLYLSFFVERNIYKSRNNFH
jgi:hypothetical protein